MPAMCSKTAWCGPGTLDSIRTSRTSSSSRCLLNMTWNARDATSLSGMIPHPPHPQPQQGSGERQAQCCPGRKRPPVPAPSHFTSAGSRTLSRSARILKAHSCASGSGRQERLRHGARHALICPFVILVLLLAPEVEDREQGRSDSLVGWVLPAIQHFRKGCHSCIHRLQAYAQVDDLAIKGRLDQGRAARRHGVCSLASPQLSCRPQCQQMDVKAKHITKGAA
jgi:hypothetical protein